LFVTDGFQSLFERVRRGDAAAAEQLIVEFESDLRIVARAVLGNSQLRRVVDSMDICQSVLGNFFLRVMAGQYDIESPEALRALLGRMVRNKVIDHARKLHSQKRGDGHPVAPLNEAITNRDQPTPSEAVALQEIVSIAMKRLSDREREIVQRRNQGENWDAIAALYGCTPDAVRKQMKRGLDRVANELHLED
jgi:RNA polymerase sigma-70 factor (ECF subfamily)